VRSPCAAGSNALVVSTKAVGFAAVHLWTASRIGLISADGSLNALPSAVIAGHIGSERPLGSPVFTKFATYDDS
jgi:hypothetical protein